MKIFQNHRWLLTLSFIILSKWSYSACFRPTFSNKLPINQASIVSVNIKSTSSKFNQNLYFNNTTKDTIDVNTGTWLSFDTINPINYRIEVKIYKQAGSVGFWVDKNFDNICNDGNINGFQLLTKSLTDPTLYYYDFSLVFNKANYSGIIPKSIRIALISNGPGETQVSSSNFCNFKNGANPPLPVFIDGEAEFYVFNLSDCSAPLSTKLFYAGQNDTICAGNTHVLSPTVPILAKGDKAYWNAFYYNFSDSVTLNQKVVSKQSDLFTLNYLKGSSQCEYSSAKIVMVDYVPTAKINMSIVGQSPFTDSICTGDSRTLALNIPRGTVGALNVTWKNKEGTFIKNTGTETSITVSEPGTYYAEVANPKILACGGPFLTTNAVFIKANAVPTVDISSKSLCVNAAILSAVTPNKIRTYTWFYNYGTATNPSFDSAPGGNYTSSDYTPTQPGEYKVTISASNYTCIGSSKLVTILPLPTTPSLINQQPSCPNTTVKLAVAGIVDPTITYEWYDVMLKAPIAKGADYSTTKAGNYYIKGISAQGCVSAASRPVQVSFVATQSIGVTPSGTITHCTNKSESFFITSTAVSSVNWYLNTVQSRPVASGSSYTSAADFSGKIYVTAASTGCYVIDSVNILLVDATKKAVISAKGNFCSGQSVSLFTDVTNGSKYTWKKDGTPIFNPSNTPSILNITASGIYDVDIEIPSTAATCPLSATAFTATFLQTPATPTAFGLKGNAILCNDKSQTTLSLLTAATGQVSYQWYKNNIAIAGNNLSTLTVADSGNYQLALYNGQCFTPVCSVFTVKMLNLAAAKISSRGGNCLGNNTGFIINSPIISTAETILWYKDKIEIPATLGGRDLKFVPTQSGQYTLSYISQGCTTATSNILDILPRLTVNGGKDVTTCAYGNVVTLKAVASTSAVTFSWLQQDILNPDKSILKVKPLVGTVSYLVSATDAVNNCVAVDTVLVIGQQNTLQISATNISPICDGGLGTSTINATGGFGFNTYTWYLPNGNKVDSIISKQNKIALNPGFYNAKVTDTLGCTQQIFEQSIGKSNSSLIKITSNLTNPTCKGKLDGAIAITLANTTGIPKVSWNIVPSQDGKTSVTGLKAGIYTLSITDDVSCASKTDTLKDPTDLIAGSISTQVTTIVSGTSASIISSVISPAGGTTPISIIWQKNEGITTPWVNMPNDKLVYFEPGILTKTTSFRRSVSNTCTTLVSNAIAINVVAALPRDSVELTGGGELGVGKINLKLYGTAPWTVILKRTDGQVQSFDTLKMILLNSFSYIPSKVGTYTVFKVNENLGRGSGAAIIYPKIIIDNSLTTAIMTGGGVLGASLAVEFKGRKLFPVTYTYLYFETSTDLVAIDTLVFSDITDSIQYFTPDKAGYYKGLSVIDSDNRKGMVYGNATILPSNTKPPTANIAGGGLIGSQITITIEANGSVAPWNVLLGIEYDSAGAKVFLVDSIKIYKTPYSFPSKRAGTYRIKAVNDNTEGNGFAIVYIEDRDSSEVFVWNAVSPNGDGKNDLFKIEIPTRLVNTAAKIVIFDREGTILSDLDLKIDNKLLINDAGNMFTYFWDCKNDSGELLNPGSYFYSFKVEGFETDKRASKSGFIEIRR